MEFIYKLETETSVPTPRKYILDYGSVVHGSSVLVDSDKKGQSIRSCLNHYKGRNPGKLVGFRVTCRKEGDKYRVIFIDPDLL